MCFFIILLLKNELSRMNETTEKLKNERALDSIRFKETFEMYRLNMTELEVNISLIAQFTLNLKFSFKD